MTICLGRILYPLLIVLKIKRIVKTSGQTMGDAGFLLEDCLWQQSAGVRGLARELEHASECRPLLIHKFEV